MLFQDKQCRDCDKSFTPFNARQVRCQDCKDQDRVACTECGGLYRPEPDSDGRCYPCETSNPRLEGPAKVPTVAELPGRENPSLTRFVLKQADKAGSRATGYDGYVSNLVRFAENASVGRVLSDPWQIKYLGHTVRSRG